jgi:uridine kinase
MNAPLLIAVVGGSAAGKGTLVRALTASLPASCGHVELDRFYRDQSQRSLRKRAATNYDHPSAIDWALVRTVFDRQRAGEAVDLPDYDFASHTRTPVTTRVPPAAILLWDGLWLLQYSWCLRRFDLSVYVDAEPGCCRERRLRRDTLERGRTPGSVLSQFDGQVLPMHECFVAPQRLWAEVVIRSPWTAAELARLARQIQRVQAERASANALTGSCRNTAACCTRSGG